MKKQENTSQGLCAICPFYLHCPLAAEGFDIREKGCYQFRGWESANKLLQINPAAKVQLLTVCLS